MYDDLFIRNGDFPIATLNNQSVNVWFKNLKMPIFGDWKNLISGQTRTSIIQIASLSFVGLLLKAA